MVNLSSCKFSAISKTFRIFNMTSGKPQFHISLFFIVLSSSYTSNLSPSVLRGGLVYSEESGLGPVYLNRNYVSFIWAINTFILEQAAQTTCKFTTLYHTLCRSIYNYVTPFDVTPTNEEWRKKRIIIGFQPTSKDIKDNVKSILRRRKKKTTQIYKKKEEDYTQKSTTWRHKR